MREGKANIQYKKLYAFEKGSDGNLRIIPEQAEVVRRIYRQYLSGMSLRMIKHELESEHIPNAAGGTTWTTTVLRSILTNEKYCGDVLLQKTFTSDCISRKVIKNTGQLPMYLIQDHHEGIVDRSTFQASQTELARRTSVRSPSKKNAPTGKSSYASKYALSERLSVENAELYTAAAHGQGMVRSGWYGAASADWIMEKNTATIHQRWMRSPSKKQF